MTILEKTMHSWDSIGRKTWSWAKLVVWKLGICYLCCIAVRYMGSIWWNCGMGNDLAVSS